MNGGWRRLVDHGSLLKPRVTALVVATAAAGMASAAPFPGAWRATGILAGIALLAGSANALNCWMERHSDGRMARTRNRPLPAGRLSPRAGLAFGLATGASALAGLALMTPPVTTLLGAAALAGYVLVYTPLKRVTPWALHVGAAAGALPPLMGRTAVTGSVDGVGLALFAVLLLWQVPHFLAIAMRRRHEYAAAGLAVSPVVRGDRPARLEAFVCTALLVPTSLSLAWLGAAGARFEVTAWASGVALLVLVGVGLGSRVCRGWPQWVFQGSIAYLTVYVLMFLVDAQPGGEG